MHIIQNYIPFDADEIPVEKNFTIEEIEYRFLLEYNSIGDFYTMTIKNLDNKILLTNRLTYLCPINDCVAEGVSMKSKLIPLNYDDPENEIPINKENFNKISIMIVGSH